MREISWDPSEINPRCLAEGYTPLVSPILPRFQLTNCETVSEMKEVAKSMKLPDEGDTSSTAIDYQLWVLLRAETLASQLHEQLEKVDIVALKRGFGAATERPEDTELLKQEKKCLEDDFSSLQAKFEKLVHEDDGKDSVIEMLKSQVKEHDGGDHQMGGENGEPRVRS